VSVVDVESLLAPISAEAPAGPDLEDDLGYASLDAASRGKPEQQFGDTVIPAEEPDWRDVKRMSLELLGRTRDLRIGVLLTQSLVRTDGLAGLADGLAVLRGWIEGMWDSVHPQLDAADPDPILRKNRLNALADAAGLVNAVRDAYLVSSRVVGRFSYRDVLVASGKLPAPAGVEPASSAAIEAAFQEVPLEAVQETSAAVEAAFAALAGLETAFSAKVGSARSVEFAPLTAMLKGMRQVLAEQLARKGAAAPDGALPEGTTAGSAPPPAAGEIRTREDVLRMLDKICDFFQSHEPSSPVPILLKRAKRLTNKSFLDLVRDLAPNGVSQVEIIRGEE
jgi:type VI secretion system protein ImpA